jgi:glyoxylase-like metal-dependent hydrolase (beta-lactamase superfamily II)
VIHTPGHTPGSSCFLLENRGILFAGDVLEVRKGKLGEPNFHFTVDRAEGARSIRKLAGLPIDTLLLAHFPPIHNAQRRLRHLADELGV